MMILTIPIRTINPLNRREHHMARARRVKAERQATRVAWQMRPRRPLPAFPLVVTLTRLAPSNGLDDDGLLASCKGVRDELADCLGLPNDRDPRVTWAYAQQRDTEYAVRVCIAQREA